MYRLFCARPGCQTVMVRPVSYHQSIVLSMTSQLTVAFFVMLFVKNFFPTFLHSLKLCFQQSFIQICSIDIIVNKTVGQKIFNCWSCEVCWSTLYHILFNMCCQCRLMSVMCYVNTYELDYMVLCQTANNNNIKKML